MIICPICKKEIKNGTDYKCWVICKSKKCDKIRQKEIKEYLKTSSLKIK